MKQKKVSISVWVWNKDRKEIHMNLNSKYQFPTGM